MNRTAGGRKTGKRVTFAGMVLCAMLLWSPGVWTEVRAEEATNAPEKPTTEVMERVETRDITPVEAPGSDLRIIQTATKLSSKRWIQSFTMDSRYYYFIQMTNPYKGHLRITRVKYKGLGRYKKDHMDLKYFGHATNLDCSEYKGRTYLWTGSNAASGSDVSRAVTCFRYRKGAVLRHHGSRYYRIRKGTTGKYVTNVYPAVSENGKKLAVRFTYKKKQYYQIYNLTKGCKINTRKLVKQIILPKTAGDFQGFDLYGTSIYTIEGSPRASFLASYDKSRVYQPTIIRSYNYKTKQKTVRTVEGAKNLSFREPEGIKVRKGRKMYVMFVSHQLKNQSCNIYQVK